MILTISIASGFGLEVATALVKRGGWKIHLFDRNEEAGKAACSSLGNAATFHKVDVIIWRELSETFQDVFTKEGRLDFVFANAGIMEKSKFYDQHPAGQIPPELDWTTVEVDMKAVYTTSYLALHYFRQSPATDKSLVMTASAAGLYPGKLIPTYGGSKHAVVGFMRCIASELFREGIRCNAICPGAFKTGLLDDAVWDAIFAPDVFGSMSFVADVVLRLVDGDTLTDCLNNRVESGKVYGQTVEISVDRVYLREHATFCDTKMARAIGIRDTTHIKTLA